jgi:hypothetical protein
MYSGEIFANMFVGWVFDKWDTNKLNVDIANERSDWMNNNMPIFIEEYVGDDRPRP